MMAETPATVIDPALGAIEPHAGLLTTPPDGQRLYKIMTVDNLLRSVGSRYLYFNRVDSYKDFPEADLNDSEQLPQDRDANAASRFAKAPGFSLADYYDQSRRRTYACCFSLESTDHVWRMYGNGSVRGKVGVIFDFAKLRATINDTLRTGSSLEYNGIRCKQIFSVNYGIVHYLSRDEARQNLERMPNPIQYTHLKDKSFAEEREMRITLSAIGIGHFVMNDGTEMEFPPGLQFPFDFGPAIGSGTITEILSGPGCDVDFLRGELEKLGIGTVEGNTVATA
jgi:hypothetical protein